MIKYGSSFFFTVRLFRSIIIEAFRATHLRCDGHCMQCPYNFVIIYVIPLPFPLEYTVDLPVLWRLHLTDIFWQSGNHYNHHTDPGLSADIMIRYRNQCILLYISRIHRTDRYQLYIQNMVLPRTVWLWRRWDRADSRRRCLWS